MIRTRERDNNTTKEQKRKKIDTRMVVAVIQRLVLTQRLQLHKLIVIASFRQKLIMCAELAHFALLEEVAV